jgi:hypothetical protein
MKNYLFLCVFAIAAIFTACENKIEILPVSQGANYMPLKKGKYLIYDVDSTVYDVLSETDHTVDTTSGKVSFQLKELIADTLKDARGRQSYKIERYRRATAADEWLLKDVWYVTQDGNSIERVEENQRFVKLVLPISGGTFFNSAKYLDPYAEITIGNETIKQAYLQWGTDTIYTKIDKPATVLNRTFDSTVTVTYVKNKDQIVDHRYYSEIYARNVGMIYKRFELTATTCTPCEGAGCITCPKVNAPWSVKSEKGFFMTMRLREYN